jgi:hypothetical protein
MGANISVGTALGLGGSGTVNLVPQFIKCPFKAGSSVDNSKRVQTGVSRIGAIPQLRTVSAFGKLTGNRNEFMVDGNNSTDNQRIKDYFKKGPFSSESALNSAGWTLAKTCS